MSSDSETSMAKAENVTSRKVAVKQTAEASLQVSFDLRHEDLNLEVALHKHGTKVCELLVFPVVLTKNIMCVCVGGGGGGGGASSEVCAYVHREQREVWS